MTGFTVVCIKHSLVNIKDNASKGSGLVVDYLTRDRGAAGSSITGVTVLWSLSKTHLS